MRAGLRSDRQLTELTGWQGGLVDRREGRLNASSSHMASLHHQAKSFLGLSFLKRPGNGCGMEIEK